MAAKTARVYTLDELKEKCQQALADPKLVDIVKTAPLNKDGNVNLSWVYKEAEKYVHEQTKDLQKTKELAVETRFLAMLRRDNKDEFEKLVSSLKPGEEKVEEKKKKVDFSMREFQVPHGTQIITKESPGYSYNTKEFTLRFCYSDHDEHRVVDFCLEILNTILEDSFFLNYKDVKVQIGNNLIQLLEEKFGLKIKICLNCKYCIKLNDPLDPRSYFCHCPQLDGRNSYPDITRLEQTCISWTPKEVSDKKPA